MPILAPLPLLPHELVVPGSISNLGAGFDTLSVAVELYLRVRVVEVLPEAPGTIVTTFCRAAPAGENRIETAFLAAHASDSHSRSPGVRLEVRPTFPCAPASAAAAPRRSRASGSTKRSPAPGPATSGCRSRATMEGHPDNVVGGAASAA